MWADIWKYLIIYINGGIYADTDIYPLKPLEKWDFYPFD